jgi:hypothetical protein
MAIARRILLTDGLQIWLASQCAEEDLEDPGGEPLAIVHLVPRSDIPARSRARSRGSSS